MKEYVLLEVSEGIAIRWHGALITPTGVRA